MVRETSGSPSTVPFGLLLVSGCYLALTAAESDCPRASSDGDVLFPEMGSSVVGGTSALSSRSSMMAEHPWPGIPSRCASEADGRCPVHCRTSRRTAHGSRTENQRRQSSRKSIVACIGSGPLSSHLRQEEQCNRLEHRGRLLVVPATRWGRCGSSKVTVGWH